MDANSVHEEFLEIFAIDLAAVKRITGRKKQLGLFNLFGSRPPAQLVTSVTYT